MLIRAEQMAVLSAASITNFKVRLLQHIRERFPHECATLGDPCTRILVDLGVANAQNYGFEGRRDICGFIDLMLTFGPDFDRDPELAWASAILKDQTLPSEAKMTTLLETAHSVLEDMAE